MPSAPRCLLPWAALALLPLLAAGMSFPADYIWAGTKRDRVRMAGNAVTPPAARDLVACVAEALGAAA